MMFKTYLASVIALAGVSAAAPSAAAGANPIGYGQQYQGGGNVNHWVVWIEGQSACPNTRVLGLLSASPCNQDFTYDSVTYHFEGCGADDEPAKVVYGGASFDCQRDDDNINCHGDAHNIVKHGYCS